MHCKIIAKKGLLFFSLDPDRIGTGFKEAPIFSGVNSSSPKGQARPARRVDK
jgi:hypothetical protein